MDSPLAILRREHQRIVELAAATEELARRIETRQAIAATTPSAATELFALYAHFIHRDKEELLLFPMLRNKGFRESGCIGPLLSEHEELDGDYDHMQQAAAAYAGGDEDAAMRWAKAAHAYCDRLRYHVRREELVFTNAEKALSPADEEELVAQFRRLDEKARRAGLEERIETAQQIVSQNLRS